MSCVTEALLDNGRETKPFPNGPTVRAVAERRVREIYCARQADKTPHTIGAAFRRGIKSAIDRQDLIAAIVEGELFIWLP
jgi:hypothetical protein